MDNNRFGEGYDIVCFHGLGGSPDDMGNLPVILESYGFKVYNMILPGHESPEKLKTITADEMMGRVYKFTKIISDRSSHGYFFIGHSFGAVLSLLIAAHEEFQPEGLVLMSAPYQYAWYQHLVIDIFSIFDFKIPCQSSTEIYIDEDAAQAHKAHPYYYTKTLKMFLDTVKKIELSINHIICPTLLQVGEADSVIPKHQSLKIFKEIDVNKELKLHTSGHMLLRDIAREQVTENITLFLKKHCKKNKIPR